MLSMEDIQNQSLQAQQCHKFSISELQIATHEFDEELVVGRGGFGKVYKGPIKIGSTQVVAAIKRLHANSSQGAYEFWAEIEMLTKLRHCNLASLIGYCNDEKDMILVYEYMPHGTLEGCLYKYGTSFSWLQRLNICIGAARGLDYLHTGTGTKNGVIHRDVKSSNILLDENYAAKISDFGLAKVGPTNQTNTFVSTGVKGTFGYMDPNYFYTNKLTRKSDVYAFGVVLLEVLCGRPAVDTSLDEEQWGLASWAQDCIREGKLSQIVDISLRGQLKKDCLKEFAGVAVSCLRAHPSQRPAMAEIVAKLEFALSLQNKMDSSSAKSNKVSNKIRSFLTAKTLKSNSLMPFCFAINDPIDVNVKKVVSKPVGSVASMVDAGYESDGDLVHFDGEFEFTLTDLFNASAKIINENPFWRTYVAYLTNGSKVVVKRILTQLSQKKFESTVSTLGKIRHPNVLHLKACYWGKGETLVVFKFTPNGSVASLLQSSKNEDGSRTAFDWRLKTKIITGVARGLFYLHAQEKIVHGDLKSNMILLDENYDPMIANVGLSKLMPATLRFRNNCAPELLDSANATTEIDVYSLGIVMLEILTRESTYKGIHPVDLPTWVRSVPTEKWFTDVFDVKLIKENIRNHNVLVKVMRLALHCVEYDPKARPTIQGVLWTLEQIEL
ncbi:hypothetical protein R6Q57_020189 [Mikania cordata]